MSQVTDRAEQVFAQGYNCAQAVLLAFGETRGLPADTALKVAGAFGGGIGRGGDLCGAVSGAIMALGLEHAKVTPDGDAARDRGYKLTREFMQRFTQKYGTTICRDLIGCDMSTPEGLARAKELGVHKNVCPKFVREAAAFVEEILTREAAADLTQAVQGKYAAVADSTLSNDHAGVRAVAEAFGYTPEELAAIPKDANMGLSCGNPTAMASLRPGETVVDLGCGGGLDVFLAAQKVGPAGKAIGIDMTPAMIARARKNAQDGGYTNVDFHLATIDKIPLPDASADVVISNCVINLAPDKPAVFREIARILKPGGRLAASDIALKKPLPTELAQDITAYVGCIAGAVMIEQYEKQLRAAGFAHVQVIDSKADLNAYTKVENQSGCCSPAMDAPEPTEAASCCCGTAKSAKPTKPAKAASSCCCGGDKEAPDLHLRLKDLLSRYNVNDYAASVKVFAVKP
jgi:arsenite methyltransferase